MAPYPPTPLIIGSTTFRAAETATAASKAFPPSSRISSPARVASGCAELTIPFVPTAGLLAVFLLAGPSTGLSSRAGSGVVGPVVSVEGRAFCVVSPVPSLARRALFPHTGPCAAGAQSCKQKSQQEDLDALPKHL